MLYPTRQEILQVGGGLGGHPPCGFFFAVYTLLILVHIIKEVIKVANRWGFELENQEKGGNCLSKSGEGREIKTRDLKNQGDPFKGIVACGLLGNKIIHLSFRRCDPVTLKEESTK